ncbi:MAG: acetate kinase [Spirochaetia bacterium]|nr:acetate kinase [Spirochaetia bacterium]
MNILVLNSGSSSIKFNLWKIEAKQLLCKGIIEKIGKKDSSMTYCPNGGKIVFEIELLNHKDGIQFVLDTITDCNNGVVKSIKDIDAVGHRVVHGGERITQSELVTKEIEKIIEECIMLAPLHNPANLEGIRAIGNVLPDVPNIAVFDTAFHSTMPPKAYVYPLPYEFYEKYKIRKYGFHGTSHKYVSLRGAEILGLKPNKFNCITCHLGNGSSIAAVKNGLSVDTTMGFTPLAGLPMGTRTGSIDPSIILYMIENLGYEPKAVNDILNKESGFKGISGISSDLREVSKAAKEGHVRAILTLKIFAHAAKKFIAGLATEMEGRVDAIIFTGGIGENSSESRELICEGLQIFGAQIDLEKNTFIKGEGFISQDDSEISILVIPTNEELMIALETQRIVDAKKKVK